MLPDQPLININQLKAEFSRLLLRIRRILSRAPNWKDNLEACKELCCYLKASGTANISLFSQEKLTEIDKCRDFKEYFEIVIQHLSWNEYYILSQIIDECGSDEAEQEFDQYKKKVALSKGLEIISSTKSSPPPGFEKFCVIIDKPYKQLTVEKYEEIKKFIFDNLEVHRYVTTGYISVLFDSIHLEWHVTVQAAPHMITIAHKCQEFFMRNSYVFMQIGKDVIINTYSEMTSVSF